MTAIRKTLLIASLSVLPGTAARPLAQRLADALTLSPTPAAALMAPIEIPPHIEGQVRMIAESQEMAMAAADFVVLVAQVYQSAVHADPDLLETAVAIRELWEQHVAGPETGLVGVSMVPPVDPDGWLSAVRQAPWIVETSSDPSGLLPD